MSVKRIKFIALLMSVAMALTLFTSGFAVWYHFKPIDTTYNESIDSFGVDDSTSFIKLTNMQVFEFSSLYFIKYDSGGKKEPTDEGKITVKYNVNIDNCKRLLSEAGETYDNTLTVELTLGYENLTDSSYKLFEEINEGNNVKTISARINDISVDASGIANNGEIITVTHTLTGLPDSGTYDMTVEYVFNVPYNNEEKIGNFRNNFGKYLKTFEEDKTQFVTTAKINTEGEAE